jgi:hypothetical protein
MPFMRLTMPGALYRLQSEIALPRCGLMRRVAQWAGWLALGTTLAGCAGIRVDSAPEDKQKFVAQRAEARWQLLIKGDIAGAYEFLSAGSKATMSAELYKAKIRPGMWREARVEKVDCEAEICKVVVQLTYDRKQMKGIQTPLTEPWIIEKGSAWYVSR